MVPTSLFAVEELQAAGCWKLSVVGRQASRQLNTSTAMHCEVDEAGGMDCLALRRCPPNIGQA